MLLNKLLRKDRVHNLRFPSPSSRPEALPLALELELLLELILRLNRRLQLPLLVAIARTETWLKAKGKQTPVQKQAEVTRNQQNSYLCFRPDTGK